MIKIIYILVIVAFLLGCTQEKELTGEVFVVVNSGQSIKLGLVEVTAFNKEKLTNCVNENKAEWTTKNQKLLDEYQAAQETSKLYFDSVEGVRALIRISIEALEAGVIPTKERESESGINELIKSLPTKEEKSEKESNNLNIVRKEYNLFQKGSFIADCVTTDIIAKATTNADGQFSMVVPNQKIALFASTSRNILGDTEDYYWFIWVNKEESHVMFSNNNTYETLCPACIVKLNNHQD